MTIARVTRYIAKCKACGAHTSALADHKRQDWARFCLGPVPQGVVFSHPRTGNVCVSCRSCGAPRIARAVKGKTVPSVVCNAKCEASHGPTCECSCGGRNHGAAHS